MACLWGLLPATAAESRSALEEFEATYPSNRWAFSPGGEFPGAKGSFDRSGDGAHSGQFSGKLAFDFTGGGNYVAAQLRLPAPAPADATNWNALQLWLKRPAGNEFTFRCSDSSGQTFQKAVECPAERWTQVTVPFEGWAGHWGGPNDGQLRGQPTADMPPPFLHPAGAGATLYLSLRRMGRGRSRRRTLDRQSLSARQIPRSD